GLCRSSTKVWPGTRAASTPAVLLVGDEVAPLGFGAFLGRLPHGDVRHEVVGRGAVPVPFARRGTHGVPGPDVDDLAAAGLDQAPAFGDVYGLAHGVAVPGAAGARCEADDGDPDARGRLAADDRIEPGVTGEPFCRRLFGRLLAQDLHAHSLDEIRYV